MTIESKALDAIKKACEKTDDEIINATSWSELNFDSLQTVELIMQMEDLFDLTIEDEDAEKLKNYNDLITFIKGKTK
jgi:acyl carrier protein